MRVVIIMMTSQIKVYANVSQVEDGENEITLYFYGGATGLIPKVQIFKMEITLL